MSSHKPPTPVRVGMKANEVLKLRGRSKAHAIGPATWVQYRQQAAWFYADCTVFLERKGDEGYRVVKVTERKEGEDL